MTKRLHLSAGTFCATLLACLSATTQAAFQDLSDRLPAASNAVVAVNVAKLLNTPYAKSEDWAATAADAWAKEPLMIPPGSTRILMASNVQTSSMEPYWEMSLIEMEKLPALDALAAAEGGYIDRVWDKDAVCSPINAYFVPLTPKILASITPAVRSEIARWLRQPVKSGGAVTSDYIKSTLANLGDQTDIVMAMDLEGAFGVPKIGKWLDDRNLKEVDPKDIPALASLLGTMKGITLDIKVDTDAKGRATVQFEREATALQSCAKPIMLAVLNTAGMRIDDVENWTFTCAGNQVTMQGPLSRPGLRRLLSIVQSPIPAATVAAKPQDGGSAAPADPAQASQRYYKAVCACLDSFRGSTSASDGVAWVRNAAKRIEQLPILNVDPDLVQWGAMVTTKLKQAGGVMVTGQTQINARVAGVMDPDYYAYSSDSNRNYSMSRDPNIENAKRQRRQAALDQKAQAQEQALQILNEIAETRPKIRAQMVDKYKVEF